MAKDNQTNHLILYFHRELEDDPVCLAWIESSPVNCVEVSLSEISLVFNPLESFNVTVIIAGHSIPGKRLRVPIKAASKIEKSLLWMMEEELALTLDKVHLSHSRSNDLEVQEAVFLVLSAEHDYLRRWIATLSRYKIQPQRLTPIHALLPESSTGTGLRLDDHIAYSDHNSCGLFESTSPPGLELIDSGVCELAVDIDEFLSPVTKSASAAIDSLVDGDSADVDTDQPIAEEPSAIEAEAANDSNEVIEGADSDQSAEELETRNDSYGFDFSHRHDDQVEVVEDAAAVQEQESAPGDSESDNGDVVPTTSLDTTEHEPQAVVATATAAADEDDLVEHKKTDSPSNRGIFRNLRAKFSKKDKKETAQADTSGEDTGAEAVDANSVEAATTDTQVDADAKVDAPSVAADEIVDTDAVMSSQPAPAIGDESQATTESAQTSDLSEDIAASSNEPDSPSPDNTGEFATAADDETATDADDSVGAESEAPLKLVGEEVDVQHERQLELCRWIERNLKNNNAINLLTGQYLPKSQLLSWQKLAQFAVWSSSLSAVALGAYFISFGTLFYLKANELDQQAHQRFRQLFPHVRQIRDIRRQTAGLISSLKRGGSGGAGLSFAEAISPIEQGLSKSGVRYEVFRIRFNQLDNKFLLSVYTDSIASANVINASLNAQGFETKLLSADSNSTQFAAIFSINTAFRSQT